MWREFIYINKFTCNIHDTHGLFLVYKFIRYFLLVIKTFSLLTLEYHIYIFRLKCHKDLIPISITMDRAFRHFNWKLKFFMIFKITLTRQVLKVIHMNKASNSWLSLWYHLIEYRIFDHLIKKSIQIQWEKPKSFKVFLITHCTTCSKIQLLPNKLQSEFKSTVILIVHVFHCNSIVANWKREIIVAIFESLTHVSIQLAKANAFNKMSGKVAFRVWRLKWRPNKAIYTLWLYHYPWGAGHIN